MFQTCGVNSACTLQGGQSGSTYVEGNEADSGRSKWWSYMKNEAHAWLARFSKLDIFSAP